jgi:hypothetical protein
MTKDGLADKVSRELHRLYDRYATPVTADERALLERLDNASKRAG